MKSISIVLPAERADKFDNGIKYSFPNCATATLLVCDDGKKLLFDTGAFGYEEALIKGLQGKRATPQEIDYVILSHAHFDHNANVHLFRNAQLIQHMWLVSLSNGKTVKFGKNFSAIPFAEPGLRFANTVGHTEDSISLFCQCEGRRYAIVGDAVKASLIKKGVISSEYSSPQMYLNNMKMICDSADVVITGEDGVIEGDFLADLKARLKYVRIEE